MCAGVNAVRKLLFLILLIPVLSWGDCPRKFVQTYDKDGNKTSDASVAYNDKFHCEVHRCVQTKNTSLDCICSDLGGVIYTTNPSGFACLDSKNVDDTGGFFYPTNFYETPHFEVKSESNSVTTQSKISITDAKAQCTDIGFKTGTERFGECVLELMQ